MLKLMRKEIEVAMESKMPLSALVSALSLIDGISKVEYPKDIQSKRYKDWWDNFAKHSDDSLDGDTVYQIRCFVMHETKMAIHSKDIDILSLSISNDFNGIGINTDIILPDGKHYYRLDLYGFCTQVCNAFDNYYKSHKESVDLADIELFVITDDDIIRWQNGDTFINDTLTNLLKLCNAGLLKKVLGVE